ncbi:uncharacterized protein VTP21DRAFT_7016 [Calcarisporiella thermophila]|uniref:uncharacterized protein n=1 Tax=Calcarisporiella thermophila TaxID=911321 RepID=UPI0037442657
MASHRKPTNYEETVELLENDECVRIAGVDIDGVLRGKIIQKSKFLSAIEHGIGFCSVIFGWDLHDKTYTEKVAVSNEETGYSDILCIPDLSTFRRIPWENNIPFFLCSFVDPHTRQPLNMCPRSLLRRQIERLKALGYEAMCGAEFEFFNFKETPETLAEKNHVNPTPLTPGMFGYSLLRPVLNQGFYMDVFNKCREFNVPLEGWHTETGPGVFEAALAYTNAAEMADRATLFKTAVKQIGLEHGVVASFMAKPHNDLPGCSGHLHFSLRDLKGGHNVFAKPEGEQSTSGSEKEEWEDARGMSQIMRWFLGGLLVALPSCMAVFAPTINSYKRLVENYWAPIVVSWGLENRIAAVRVISPPVCNPSATRLEMRVSGADINPHLAIAAVLAAGAWGIENKVEIPISPLKPNEKLGERERLAKSLIDATRKLMESGSIARQVLGDGFVDHYGKTRLHEWRLWETAVTEWEVRRYLELI